MQKSYFTSGGRAQEPEKKIVLEKKDLIAEFAVLA